MRHARVLPAATCLVIGITSVAGCSVEASEGAPPSHQGHADVSTINGSTPPGTPARLVTDETLLDVTDDEGMRHLVMRGVRAPGTRTPIHVHPFGGSTCVLEGEMTLYLQDAPDQVAHAGECYWMPAGRAMSGGNTGSVDAVLHDIFTVPAGQSVWQVVEPGQSRLQDNFATGN